MGHVWLRVMPEGQLEPIGARVALTSLPGR